MISTLKALLKTLGAKVQSPLVELAGAAAVTVGVTQRFGGAAGWIAAGVALLLKSGETPPSRDP
jgi:uncharacterized membrane protein YbhN (UPF0104 family)